MSAVSTRGAPLSRDAIPGARRWRKPSTHLRDAASLYVESLVAHGEPIPIGEQGQRSAAERDLVLTV